MSEVKKIATREAYGEELAALGEEYPQIVVMDADLSGSTRSSYFAKKFPDRFFNAGIAEQNMMGIAAGLATCGKIPFVSSFAMFATGRPYEQIRNSIAYPYLNVKIGASHAGISVGADGASHQCLEDVALMRNLPNMVVLVPADYVEARAVVRAAAEHEGPVYMRFGRAPVPCFFDADDFHFQIGKAHILRPGKDVTIAACGLTLYSSLQAADLLAADGIDAEVIDVCSIKPLDEEMILASAAKTHKVVTAEEAWITGGLGSAVAELLSEKLPTRLYRIGVGDTFGESGPADDLIARYRLDAKGVYEQVKEFVGKC